MSDALNVLFHRLRASDRGALEQLYSEMADPLARFAYGFTGDKNEALDIVHDVFVKIWERRKSIRINKTGKSFLYAMIRNHFLNLKKRANRSVATDFTDPNSPWHSLGFSTTHSESDSALKATLLAWIEELPPRRSEAFMLSRFHDLSHQQIAHVMGLSERTVDTHIQHALRDLRIRMNQNEVAI